MGKSEPAVRASLWARFGLCQTFSTDRAHVWRICLTSICIVSGSVFPMLRFNAVWMLATLGNLGVVCHGWLCSGSCNRLNDRTRRGAKSEANHSPTLGHQSRRRCIGNLEQS